MLKSYDVLNYIITDINVFNKYSKSYKVLNYIITYINALNKCSNHTMTLSAGHISEDVHYVYIKI